VDGIELSRYLEGLTYDIGTTLGSYLLAQQWAVPAPEEPHESPLHHRIHTPTILIVEDDADTRLILSHLLQYHGWLSHTAADGKEALAALEQHRPALILLDLAMPRMDGMEFRAAQRQLSDRRLANVPVVVVTAVHDGPRYKSALHAAAVLVKPIEADRLLAAVETHVRPSSLFQW
jgi:CheY-like chemotaxis protein